MLVYGVLCFAVGDKTCIVPAGARRSSCRHATWCYSKTWIFELVILLWAFFNCNPHGGVWLCDTSVKAAGVCIHTGFYFMRCVLASFVRDVLSSLMFMTRPVMMRVMFYDCAVLVLIVPDDAHALPRHILNRSTRIALGGRCLI